MKLEQIMLILNLAVPLAAGAFFAFVGLTKKYTTKLKYACSSILTWIYILLSAGGSLLFTQLIKVIGTTVIADPILNSIILGLIGPGVFLGVISKFTISGFSDSDVDKQITTLKDYVYDILDTSILRKTTQRVELKIREAGEKVSPEILLTEAKGILESVTGLDTEQKKAREEKFTEFATRGDYAPIIRELIQHYDVDHIIRRLSYSVGQRQSSLQELVQIALEDQDPEQWEFVVAKVRAMQKEPDSSLHYLRLAMDKDSSLKQQIQKNVHDLRVFRGMTRGKSQIEKIRTLNSLIGIEEMPIEDVEDLRADDELIGPGEDRCVILMAVRQNNGDCVKITIRRNQSKWCIWEDDKPPEREYANFNDLVAYIQKNVFFIQRMRSAQQEVIIQAVQAIDQNNLRIASDDEVMLRQQTDI